MRIFFDVAFDRDIMFNLRKSKLYYSDYPPGFYCSFVNKQTSGIEACDYINPPISNGYGGGFYFQSVLDYGKKYYDYVNNGCDSSRFYTP